MITSSDKIGYPKLDFSSTRNYLLSAKKISFSIFYANSKWSAPKPKCTTCFKNPILNGFFQNPERGFRIPDPSLASSAVHEFEKKKSILEKKYSIGKETNGSSSNSNIQFVEETMLWKPRIALASMTQFNFLVIIRYNVPPNLRIFLISPKFSKGLVSIPQSAPLG